jgi:hypothetical protein
VTWRVSWTVVAEQELTDIWMVEPDQDAIPRAANALDLRLEQSADTLGESRSANRRVAFEPPLGILFEVFPASQLVRVLHVWRYQTPAE